jgi:hypothetical protein
MIEYLGSDGLVPPDADDADIRYEFVCAGREVTFGFDTIGGIFGRPPSLAMREYAELRRHESTGGHRSSAAA